MEGVLVVLEMTLTFCFLDDGAIFSRSKYATQPKDLEVILLLTK